MLGNLNCLHSQLLDKPSVIHSHDDDDDDYNFRPVGPPEGYKDVLS